MSLLVGDVVTDVAKSHPEIPAHVVASALAIICGCIITFIGLIRMGRIVELISLSAISAFMTGSAINIAVGQVPALMGITGFDTRDHTYRVIINTLKGLPGTKLDAAMGLTALTMLYLIRGVCSYAAKKNPNRRKTFFFIATLRTAFVILLYTMISWLVNRHHRDKKQWRFSLVGKVPRGTSILSRAVLASRMPARLTDFLQGSRTRPLPRSTRPSSKPSSATCRPR